jgi:hypothetical protein
MPSHVALFNAALNKCKNMDVEDVINNKVFNTVISVFVENRKQFYPST